MSALDCDLDFDAQPAQRDDRALMIEPWKLFGCDESVEPTGAKESDGLREAANPSVTQKFCLPDRTTPLSSDEGPGLWERLRRNGYATCSIKGGSKEPFGKEWQKKAFREVTGWMARAPGIGLVCGNLDQNGKPAPVAGSLIVVDCDFRLMKAVADYDRLASEALLKKQPSATRLRKIADHLRAIAPALAEKEQSLSRLLREQGALAKLRASTLERGRANSPNFALLVRNGGALGNDTPKFYLPVHVDGKTELIEAFGIDRLAAGKQLVGYHLHPDTGRPWLWENNRSPEGVPLVELPPIDAGQWDALWRGIASAGAVYGDRNLVCACAPMETYIKAAE